MARMIWKGGALMAPLPAVLVTSGTLDRPNVMTAAWTGVVNTHPPKTYISLRKTRYTYEKVLENRSFVINLTPASLVWACDFCGVRSGRELDKFEKTGLTPVPSVSVEAPSLAEAPLSLECALSDVIPLGSHDMFLADILSVTVREELIDGKGRMALEKADLLAYVHGEYYALGRRLGSFGYSVRKKTCGSKKTEAAAKRKNGENDRKSTVDYGEKPKRCAGQRASAGEKTGRIGRTAEEKKAPIVKADLCKNKDKQIWKKKS